MLGKGFSTTYPHIAMSAPLPTLHFAHANGFPAGSYRQLFAALEGDCRLIAIDKLGHSPDYPVDNNWSQPCAELIAYIEQHASEPVIGVGHSFGAIVSFLAAHQRPELFRQLIMLDPPLALGHISLAFLLGKKLGFIDRITPAGRTQYRKQYWPNQQAAEDYCASKALFKGFSKSVIQDYLAAATSKDKQGGLQLNFCVDVECDVFRTIPDHLDYLREPLSIPATLVRGSQSEVLRPRFAKRLAKQQNMQLIEFPGSHLFPLQH